MTREADLTTTHKGAVYRFKDDYVPTQQDIMIFLAQSKQKGVTHSGYLKRKSDTDSNN